MGTLAGLEYPEGDPGGLSAAAGRLSRLASEVAGEAAGVARAGRVGGWEGPAYAVFTAAVRALGGPLDRAASTLRRASNAVDDLAEQIESAQTKIKGWADEIEQAQAQVDTAAQAVRDATLGGSTELFGDSFGLSDTGLSAQVQARARLDRSIRRLDELRTRYQPMAARLCEQIVRADRATAAAVLGAAGAAPAGGAGVPGAPRVPADVRLFAPVWLFAPGESYLPADPRALPDDIDSFDELRDYLRGQGAGAPIFYRVRRYGDEKIIEYWFYRRHNDFRDLGIPGVSSHPDDSEGIAVRIRDGRPVQIGYTQHEHGCSLPYGDAPKHGGHPVSYPGDGSGSNSPYRGHDDRVPGPYDDLHGPAPGEDTPRDHVVNGEDNLTPYRGGAGWVIRDPEGNRVPGNGANSGKFPPGSPVWGDECEPLPARD